MGHSNLNTTDMIYGHLYPVNHEQETARMDEYQTRRLPPVAARVWSVLSGLDPKVGL